jgi:hypothetical protein
MQVFGLPGHVIRMGDPSLAASNRPGHEYPAVLGLELSPGNKLATLEN